ncbi:M23 family metallopeptidase [Candidatus Daviesbacteria bacterium]|nr:M23 family metallopeptidase [Candidatus Daviesbacteria bacterium]
MKLSSKIALGVICLLFFLDYQPVLGIPPIRKAVVRAQAEQSQTINPQENPIVFQLPHPGYLSTPFSSYHPGIDMATGLGMPIKPIAKGEVIEEGYNFWGLGLMVVIKHDQGYISTYGHLGKIYVKKGQVVDVSNYIGEVGLTGHTSGPHTHLEITKDSKKVDPVALLPKIREIPTEADFIPVTAKGGPISISQ